MTNANRVLLPLFLHLVRLNGQPLAERVVADVVTRLLQEAGVRVVEDRSGPVLGGDTGNLFCFPPGYDPHHPGLMLIAHLDTVQPIGSRPPVVLADRVMTDGSAILGADNRAGVTVLMQTLIEAARSESIMRNFFVVFTVAEESGFLGASQVDLKTYPVSAAFVFDCARRPGVYIRECAGLQLFTVQVHGRGAHAGIAPEEGINAIALAAKAVAALTIGRIDDETTVNVGTISGGRATDFVPDLTTVSGEVRSFLAERIRWEMERIESAFRSHIDASGSLEFRRKTDYEPYILKPDAVVVQEVERALRAVGLKPEPVRDTGGSDANVFNARGIQAVNIGIGVQKPHSNEEFILLEDLEAAFRIAQEIVRGRV